MNHQALVFLSENIESFHSDTNLCNLLYQSIIDQYQFDVIDRAAKDLVNAIDTCGPLCETSRRKWQTLQKGSPNISVNYYNLLQYNTLLYYEKPIIQEQMMGTVRQKLHIVPDDVTWQSESHVFTMV